MVLEKIKTLLNIIIKKLIVPCSIIIGFHYIIFWIIRNTGFLFPIYMVLAYIFLSTVLALYFIIIE